MTSTPLASCLGPTLPIGHPETRAIAVMTVNGQAALGGTSQSLGSPMDAALLQHLRFWSDAVLVGARTVRAENYGGVKVPDDIQAQRVARGQTAVPPIAVISRSLDFEESARLFIDTDVPPIFLTTSTDAAAKQRITDLGAQVIEVPDEDYVGALHARGLMRVSVEGGPGIFARAFRRSELDLLHLTIDPSLAFTQASPLLYFQEETQHSVGLDLEHHCADQDGCVFLRYRVRK